MAKEVTDYYQMHRTIQWTMLWMTCSRGPCR